MTLHINDMIAKGAEESDIEAAATDIYEDTFGDDSASVVDTVLIVGQLDALEQTADGKPRWTPKQQELIARASAFVDEYTK